MRYLGLGSFDITECTGVLHHLKNPLFGLNVLKDALTEKGKMILMVYAKYGRTAVYHTQHLMKMINSNAASDIEIELENTKQIISSLPDQNWFASSNLVTDHNTGNIGIYDLLLHKRDVSYSFQAVFEWIRHGGLHFVEVDDYFHRYSLKPRHVFKDDKIRRIVTKLNIAKAYHVAEILQGKIIKQQFYTSKCHENTVDIHDPSNVININGHAIGLRDAIDKKRYHKIVGNQTFFQATLSPRGLIQYQTDSCLTPPKSENSRHVTIGFRSNKFTKFLIKRLLRFKEGVKLKNLFSDYKEAFDSTLEEKQLQTMYDEFYDSVKDSGIFLLKKDHIEQFPKTKSYICFKISS